ncbi:hypothetical protein LguiA_027299 [Lonicera macranthoides]
MATTSQSHRFCGPPATATGAGNIDALNKVLADLCTKGNPKDGAALALRKHVEEEARDLSGEAFSRFMDLLYDRITSLLESNDVAENLGALRAIDELIDLTLGESASKVSKFTKYMQTVFEVKRDPKILILASKVLGHLARAGGAMTADEVERQVKTALDWLRNERVEYRRFAAVLILKEMAENASTVFNVHVPEFVDAIWVALRDPTLAVRERAVEALRACLRVIEKRETRWRVQWYYRMFEATQNGLGRNAPVHSIHGSLLAVGELLRNTGEFMMSRYREVAEIVLRYLEHRDRLVRLSITSLLPRIAHFLRDRFVTNYLTICMDHILAVLKIPAERASGFIALGEMAGALDGELVHYLPTITIHLREAIAPRRGAPSLEALACVGNIAKAMGTVMEPHVRSLLDAMFSAGLSFPLVEALEQITISIPSLLPTIQERLLESISAVLSRSHHAQARPSVPVNRGNLTSTTQQVPELSGSALVQLALQTLARFNFKGHDLLEFARESVVLYLEDEDGATRKDAALCCCKLVANSFSGMSSTQFTSTRSSRAGGKRRRLVEEVCIEATSLYSLLIKISVPLALLPIGLVKYSTRLHYSCFYTNALSKVANCCMGSDKSNLGCQVSGGVLHNYRRYLSTRPAKPIQTRTRYLDFHLPIALQIIRLTFSAVADADVSVRHSIFSSLHGNGGFDDFLAQADSLTAIFAALNDEDFEVREYAISVAGRLSEKNPAYVLPALRRHLIQLLTYLKQSADSKYREESAKLLGCLIRNCERLILPYVAPIHEALVAKLCEGTGVNANNGIISGVLVTVGDLARVGGFAMRQYIPGLMPLIVEALLDGAAPTKREVAVATLGQVVQSTGVGGSVASTTDKSHLINHHQLRVENHAHVDQTQDDLVMKTKSKPTGHKAVGNFSLYMNNGIIKEVNYVITPYNEYKPLLSLLLKLLNGELAWSTRREVLKVLGIMGALDPHVHKRNQQSLPGLNGEVNRAASEAGQHIRSMDELPMDLWPSFATSEDYFPTVAINSLMRILRDPSLSSYHQQVVGSLMFIFKSMGLGCVPYLPKVLPDLFHTVRTCEDGLREYITWKLGTLVSIVRQHIRKYLPELLSLISELWSSFSLPTVNRPVHGSSILHLVEQLCLALNDEFRTHLPIILPCCIQVLSDAERYNDYTYIRDILHTLEVFGGTLDEHMHLLLPALIRLFKVNASVEIRRAAIKTLTRLIPCVQVTGHISALTHHLKLVLDGKNDELRKDAVDALCCLAHALGEDFTIFVPSIHKLLQKHRLRHKEFEEIEGRLQRREPPTSQRLTRRLPVEVISDPLSDMENDPYEDGKQPKIHQMASGCLTPKELHETSLSFVQLLFPFYSGRSEDIHTWFDRDKGLDEVLKWVYYSLGCSNSLSHDRRYFGLSGRNIAETASQAKVNDGRLRAAGEASQRSTKEDWAEWMRHFSNELLKESPSPALRTCAKLAQLQPFVGRELFAAGFVSCWSKLGEVSQRQLVRSLEMAFSSPNIPPEILATLLNLVVEKTGNKESDGEDHMSCGGSNSSIVARGGYSEMIMEFLMMAEFMEHDERPLPIDIRLLGALADKCRAFAKALHYKEMEFEGAISKKMDANPVAVVELLIHINSQLHQHEAAVGILTYAQQHLDVQLKESWYEKLQRWDDALKAYNAKALQASSPHLVLDATLGRMRCLAALARWEELSNLCKEYWTPAEPAARLEMAPMAASAAWNLGEWDQMHEYVSRLDDGDETKLRVLGNTAATGDGGSNGTFFRAVLLVRRGKYDEAREYVERARKCLATELAALVLESYERAYSNMVRVQQLSELEEVIDYCSLPVGNPIAEGRRALIRNMWNERIKGAKRNVEVWQAFLAVRALVLPPTEDSETWLKFVSLCRKSGRISQARSTLVKLLQFDPETTPENVRYHGPPQVMLAYLKYQWSLGEDHRRQEAFVRLRDLAIELSRVPNLEPPTATGLMSVSSVPLLARVYLKLGAWQWLLSPGLDDDSIQEILGAFRNATHYATEWAKAWHKWALFNTAVMSHYTLRGLPGIAAQFVVAAVTGYFHSIACAAHSKGVDDSLQHLPYFSSFTSLPVVLPYVSGDLTSSSEDFWGEELGVHDILRLLTLWFNHGATAEVQMALKKGFADVNINTWLVVLPQIIARIHSNNHAVRELIQSLLVRIGQHHPQRNEALLGKWIWRFPIEQDSPWCAIIRSKYGFQKNGWDSNVVVKSSYRNPWKAISANIENFVKFTRLKVGNGEQIKFWTDLCVRNESLASLFSRLHRLSNYPDSTIASCLSREVGSAVNWNLTFRRNFNDRETNDFLRLINMGGCNGESIDHLVVHCPFVHSIWNNFRRELGIISTFPKSWFDLLLIEWSFRGNKKKSKILWRSCCMAILWCVWGERNRRIFEGKSELVDEVWQRVKSYASLWAYTSSLFSSISLDDLRRDWCAAALMYPLLVACKSISNLRKAAAQEVVDKVRQHSGVLVDQAQLVSKELIRVAILWHEMWHEALEEASRLYFGERNIEGMLKVLEPLHELLEEGATRSDTTTKEKAFIQAYHHELLEAYECCMKYKRTGKDAELTQAWDLYYHVFRRIDKQLQSLTTLDLKARKKVSVSPELLECRDLELAVPGTYRAGSVVVTIASFACELLVITSKQRPRKLTIHGSDGEDYAFLLKGHEDLRQDERVMQLFGLVNTLLENSRETAEKDLSIQRYDVIPLSPNSGLIEWVPHCDTLHHLIREYRDARRKNALNQEHKLMLSFAPDYDHLPLIAKVEVFEYALENTEGNDLARVLWLKSRTSEVWLDRRTNYTRSLAVMSMVGYLLGLGDRHPSNLMLHRYSGKILHIDFGDCFEASMNREKFPEKVPFRLTRMLVKAMEVSGIEGNFRSTCQNVMQVLRTNKDSVMAMMEAFVHDPLINWRLFNFNEVAQMPTLASTHAPPVNSEETGPNKEMLQPQRGARERELLQAVNQLGDANEVLNERAVVVMARMSNKLTGRDFSTYSSVSSSSTPHTMDHSALNYGDNREVDHGLSVKLQVQKLILQATSHENLCQNYVGSALVNLNTTNFTVSGGVHSGEIKTKSGLYISSVYSFNPSQ